MLAMVMIHGHGQSDVTVDLTRPRMQCLSSHSTNVQVQHGEDGSTSGDRSIATNQKGQEINPALITLSTICQQV